MKIIKLYAYLRDNLGDDLMVDCLLKRYPDVLFFYENPKNIHQGDQFNCYGNFYNLFGFYTKWGRINHLLNIITLNKKPDFFYDWLLNRIHKRISGSVYIGGSLYQQSVGTSAKKEESKLNNGPLFVIGANFGPYTDNNYLKSFHEYFAQCRGVCFRDKKSYDLFSDIPQVSWAPDIVLNRDKSRRNNNGNSVLISVIDFRLRPLLREYADDYFDFIKRVCYKAIEMDLHPVLVSFCKYEGDEDAVNYIFDSLDLEAKEKTSKFFYHQIMDLDNLFDNVCFVVATRFHAMILAIVNEIPFFSIAYNTKVSNVLDDIGWHAYCYPNDLSDMSAEQVFEFTYSFEEVKEYKHSAKEQFAGFDAFINNL